ncbi:hypothetical protein HWI79_1451 [Cryptosporidium felis]|nr:hypothetical protein HWI79_1451 [Cryptosporidium felis]
MNKFDIDIISLLQGDLNEESDKNNSSENDYKNFALLSAQSSTAISNFTHKKSKEFERSYIIPLLASEYPKRLLSDYRTLDLDSQTLRNSIQNSSLKNSTRVIKKNKDMIIKLNENFLDFEKNMKNSIFNSTQITIGKVRSNHLTVIQNLIQFRKLSALNKIIQMLVEFIELPNLIESFVSTNMIDDALDTLEYGESCIKLLRLTVESSVSKDKVNNKYLLTMLINKMKHKIDLIKDFLYLSLKSRIDLDQLSLISTLEVIGQLRRLVSLQDGKSLNGPTKSRELYFEQEMNVQDGNNYTDKILAKIFLLARSEYVEFEYLNKSIMLSRINRYASLKLAISLFNNQLVSTISTFNSLFSNQNLQNWPSNTWLNNYVNWFIFFCKKVLTLVKNNCFYSEKELVCKIKDKSIQTRSLKVRTVYTALFDLDNIPITSSSCQDLYLQTFSAFSFSKPTLLLVLPLFENYIVEYYRKMLEFSIMAFELELKQYCWTKELDKDHTKVVDIKPLSVFYNEFTNTINELKQCPLKSIQFLVIELTNELVCLSLDDIQEIGKSNISITSALTQSECDSVSNNIDLITEIYNSEIVPYIYTSIFSIFNGGKQINNPSYNKY